jgi:2-haloalkanoic acid dehalogenase type II
MIKYIFFDLGDTLVDMSISNESLNFGLKSVISNSLVTNEIISKWEKESYETFKYYYDKGEFYTIKKLQALSLKKILDGYNINLTEEKFSFAVDNFWRYFIKNCKLHRDVVHTLSNLSHNEYKLGLITDSDKENVTRILKKHNLNKTFKVIVISSVLKKYKPDVLLFQRALELAQCFPQEAIYVGDSVIDIHGAKKLGLITILVERNKSQDNVMEVEPDFIIDNLQKVSTIIDKIEM